MHCVPTIITYKAGASDDTTESDVRVQYLSEEEIRDCIQEQGQRYRAAFPCQDREQTDEAGHVPFDIGGEDDMGDVEDDEDITSQVLNNNTPHRKTIRPSDIRGAKTARSFFEIIFGTSNDEHRKNALEHDLKNGDLEDDSFVDACMIAAMQRLEGISALDGFSQLDVISDEDLADSQEVTSRVWPLVKSVYVVTGHVLLRNNVCIIDLPGYGDDNHIRTALIDRFRDMANFEVVVAPTSRVVSSVVQERYLNRPIRRLGARNTLLVTNKSDQLFNSLRKQIRKLDDAPFPKLKQTIASIEEIGKKGTEERNLVQAYREYLLKEARSAYIEREASIVRSSLQDKSVDILSVSAREYSLCLDAEQEDEKAKLTPKATGLPSLRRYLFSLPAQTNYRTLHYYIFEMLPDIVAQIQRTLEKFDDDDGYSKMREYLAEQLPRLRTIITGLAKSLPAERVVKPFVGAEATSRVNSGLTAAVQALATPIVYCPTFAKMLKENGIPTNGAGLGFNFNQEILNTMIQFIEGWQAKMQIQTENLAAEFDAPVRCILEDLKGHVQHYEGNPELKRCASELLETTTRRVGMAHDKMLAELQRTLRDNQLLYSTEINVKRPIALEMRDTYQKVLVRQITQPGKGSYARQRDHLFESLMCPDPPKLPIVDAMQQKLVNAQVISWQQCCEQFVSEAMSQLQDLSRAVDELLNNGSHLSSEHRRIRKQLGIEFPKFRRQLIQVQNRFPRTEASQSFQNTQTQHTSSNKRKPDDEQVAAQYPASTLDDDTKRLKTTSQPSPLGAMSAQPVVWLRKIVLSGLEQKAKPAIKKEPNP